MIQPACPERALWLAVRQRQAMRDALGTPSVHLAAADIRDARDFLAQPDRLADLCEALGLHVAWVQAQLRQFHPALFAGQEERR